MTLSGGIGQTRPVRIAILLSYPLSYQDGVSRFATALLDALRTDFAVNAFLLAPVRFGAAPRRPISQLLVAAQQLLRLLRTRPDVAHVHEHPVVLAAAILYRALTRGRVHLVHTVHIEPVERRSYWKRAMLGWLMGRCSVVTAVSDDTASRLACVASPPPRSVSVIHGGARITTRRPDDPLVVAFRSKYGLTGGPVLCQIGLNFPRKVAGAVRLIEAFALARREFPDARLVLVGDGPLRHQVEAARVREGVADAVVLVGYQDDVSLPLTAADLYCHITFQDACPLSLLEAMQSEKPVIAARMGGIPELITDGVDGLLVQPEAQEIAQAITRLLKNPDEARALAARAAVTGRTRFSWRRVAAEFAAVYGITPAAQAPRAEAEG